MGGSFRSLLPSDLFRAGALARESLPATRGAEYATPTNKGELVRMMRRQAPQSEAAIHWPRASVLAVTSMRRIAQVLHNQADLLPLPSISRAGLACDAPDRIMTAWGTLGGITVSLASDGALGLDSFSLDPKPGTLHAEPGRLYQGGNGGCQPYGC